jgi:hypothetical protein
MKIICYLVYGNNVCHYPGMVGVCDLQTKILDMDVGVYSVPCFEASYSENFW